MIITQKKPIKLSAVTCKAQGHCRVIDQYGTAFVAPWAYLYDAKCYESSARTRSSTVSIQRRKKLKRRCYRSLGPNDCWHIDGYGKIKSFGFPIIGCIDGFSRKILWLEIVNSNNDPFVTASAYLNFISELDAIPRQIGTDCGTENCVLAALQCYFRKEHTDKFGEDKAHIYRSSPINGQNLVVMSQT